MNTDVFFKLVRSISLIFVILTLSCHKVNGHSRVRVQVIVEELPNGEEESDLPQNIRDVADGRFYLEYTNGPCKEFMKFYRHPDPFMQGFGYCDCFQRSASSMDLGYLYDPTTNRCYPAYSEGPCKRDQWFVLDPISLVPGCRSNKCWQEVNRDRPSVLLYNDEDKRCYIHGSKGFCLHGGVVQPTEKSTSTGISVGYATCGSIVAGILPRGIPTLRCEPGNRWSMTSGKCSATAKSLWNGKIG